MNDNQKKIGIGAIIVILCALAYYFLYWVKTPAYSLGLIREAVQKHDVVKFEKHVDLDTLYNKAFDDAIVAQGAVSGEDLMSNPFAAGIIQAMKPGAVALLKNETLKAIKGEEVKVDEKQKKEQPIANGLTNKFGKATNEIKDVSTISKEGDIANVLVKVYDSSVKGEYDVKLKMIKLDDGTWKIKEVTNLPQMISDMDKLYKKRLAEINAPVQKQIDETMRITATNVYVRGDGNPFFQSYKVHIPSNFENISNKDIVSFSCLLVLKDTNNKELLSGIYSDHKGIKAKNSYKSTLNKGLNQFIGSEKKLIDNPSQVNATYEIKEIKLADGKELKILDTIPDPNEDKDKKAK